MPTDHSYYKSPLDYEDIIYEVEPPLARIILNRPDKMNALRHQLRGELFHALRVAESDRDGLLGIVLADDVLIERSDDRLGSELVFEHFG